MRLTPGYYITGDIPQMKLMPQLATILVEIDVNKLNLRIHLFPQINWIWATKFVEERIAQRETSERKQPANHKKPNKNNFTANKRTAVPFYSGKQVLTFSLSAIQ